MSRSPLGMCLLAYVSTRMCVWVCCCCVSQAPPPKPKPKKIAKDKEERDPQLPTSVPLPSAVEDITDAGMRAMWEQEQAMDGEAAPEALGS